MARSATRFDACMHACLYATHVQHTEFGRWDFMLGGWLLDAALDVLFTSWGGKVKQGALGQLIGKHIDAQLTAHGMFVHGYVLLHVVHGSLLLAAASGMDLYWTFGQRHGCACEPHPCMHLDQVCSS